MKVGYAAILGKPNAGKSTLINALVGEKVSIVSWKPQTTRNLIQGIVNGKTADCDYQIVFVDTPGIQNGKNKLARYMSRGVEKAIDEISVIIYVINGAKYISNEELSALAQLAAANRVIAVINKQDIADREEFLERVRQVGEVSGLVSVVPMSVFKRNNLDTLIAEVLRMLPEGEALFDAELYTDQSMRFMSAEIIREKAILNLSEEIPYGIGVGIDRFFVRENETLVEIDATIYCEKQAHKGIIIGRGGSMMRKISTEARADIERMIGVQVFLTIWVKVKPDWRDSDYTLNEIGYNLSELGKPKKK